MLVWLQYRHHQRVCKGNYILSVKVCSLWFTWGKRNGLRLLLISKYFIFFLVCKSCHPTVMSHVTSLQKLTDLSSLTFTSTGFSTHARWWTDGSSCGPNPGLLLPPLLFVQRGGLHLQLHIWKNLPPVRWLSGALTPHPKAAWVCTVHRAPGEDRESPCSRWLRRCPPLCGGRYHQLAGVFRQRHLLHHSRQHQSLYWHWFINERVPQTQAHLQGETGRGPVWRSIYNFVDQYLEMVIELTELIFSSVFYCYVDVTL